MQAIQICYPNEEPLQPGYVFIGQVSLKDFMMNDLAGGLKTDADPDTRRAVYVHVTTFVQRGVEMHKSELSLRQWAMDMVERTVNFGPRGEKASDVAETIKAADQLVAWAKGGTAKEQG